MMMSLGFEVYYKDSYVGLLSMQEMPDGRIEVTTTIEGETHTAYQSRSFAEKFTRDMIASALYFRGKYADSFVRAW